MENPGKKDQITVVINQFDQIVPILTNATDHTISPHGYLKETPFLEEAEIAQCVHFEVSLKTQEIKSSKHQYLMDLNEITEYGVNVLYVKQHINSQTMYSPITKQSPIDNIVTNFALLINIENFTRTHVGFSCHESYDDEQKNMTIYPPIKQTKCGQNSNTMLKKEIHKCDIDETLPNFFLTINFQDMNQLGLILKIKSTQTVTLITTPLSLPIQNIDHDYPALNFSFSSSLVINAEGLKLHLGQLKACKRSKPIPSQNIRKFESIVEFPDIQSGDFITKKFGWSRSSPAKRDIVKEFQTSQASRKDALLKLYASTANVMLEEDLTVDRNIGSLIVKTPKSRMSKKLYGTVRANKHAAWHDFNDPLIKATLLDTSMNYERRHMSSSYSSISTTSCILSSPTSKSHAGDVSEIDIKQIKQDLLKFPLFTRLPSDQLDRICNAVSISSYSAGERIMKKGERGDVFFMIKSGSVKVTDAEDNFGDHVLTVGEYFGEKALIDKKPNDISVTAVSNCVFMTLDKPDFNAYMLPLRGVLELNAHIKIFSCIQIFQKFSMKDKARLVKSFEFHKYGVGETIIKEGERDRKFFVIKEGQVQVSHDGVVGGILGPGKHFGEVSLLESDEKAAATRMATLVAVTSVTCFSLDKEVFNRLMASIQAEAKTGGGSTPTKAAITVQTGGGGVTVGGLSPSEQRLPKLKVIPENIESAR